MEQGECRELQGGRPQLKQAFLGLKQGASGLKRPSERKLPLQLQCVSCKSPSKNKCAENPMTREAFAPYFVCCGTSPEIRWEKPSTSLPQIVAAIFTYVYLRAADTTTFCAKGDGDLREINATWARWEPTQEHTKN